MKNEDKTVETNINSSFPSVVSFHHCDTEGETGLTSWFENGECWCFPSKLCGRRTSVS